MMLDQRPHDPGVKKDMSTASSDSCARRAGRVERAGRPLYDGTVLVWPPIAVIAPELPETRERGEVHVGDDEVVLRVGGLREDLAARRDDHAVAVVVALRAAGVHAHLVDAADVVDVGDRVGAELEVQRYRVIRVVAVGTKTISAPSSPSTRAASGKWRS
jgi:hypothetical protein